MPEATMKTRPIGRALRLLLSVCLIILALPVYLKAGWRYNLQALGVTVALALFYILVHWLIARFVPNLNKWVGALVAATPVVVVFILGQGGAPIFGEGEGATGVITYLWLSFLIDFARSDSGCEVMALPGLLFKERTHLPCLALCPFDWLEERFA